MDVVIGQVLLDVVPRLMKGGELGLELGPDRRQLLGRGHTVGRRFQRSGQELVAEAGHPDHEELVQVGGEDGQELDSFEQGAVLVESFFKDAQIELEPAQLAVDVQLRAAEVRVAGMLFDRAFNRHWFPHSPLSEDAHCTEARQQGPHH